MTLHCIIDFIYSANEGYSTEKVKISADFIKGKISKKPKIGIICGSGLGGIAEVVTDKTVLLYKDIPSFVESTGMLYFLQSKLFNPNHIFII